MKTYTGWQAVYLSLFSKDLYRDVARNWKGISFLYLFLLVTVSWLLISIRFYMVLDEVIKGPVAKVIEQLPAVTIKDGQFTMDKPSPYELKFQPNNAGSPMVLAVFDSRTDDIKGHEDAPFLVTKHYFLVQNKEGKAQQIEMKSFGDVEYTRASYAAIADMIKVWVPILMFSVFGPISFIICAVMALIIAAIGMAVAGMVNVKLTYGELVRIAAVAFTPAVILDTVLKVFLVPQSLIWFILGFALPLGYTIFGVMANKETITPIIEVPGTPTI